MGRVIMMEFLNHSVRCHIIRISVQFVQYKYVFTQFMMSFLVFKANLWDNSVYILNS